MARRTDVFDKFKLAVAAIIVLFIVGGAIAVYSSAKDITCQVQSIDRVSDGNGGSDARIYTKDCGVLVNKDSFMFLKWDSADVQAAIHPGQTQTFHVAGFRVPFFSSFPNILEVK